MSKHFWAIGFSISWRHAKTLRGLGLIYGVVTNREMHEDFLGVNEARSDLPQRQRK